MNFTYLSSFPRFKKLYEYCSEAEEFAVSKPNISATSARKAMEFMVKFIYRANVSATDYGLTVFEMITDERFVAYVNDSVFINSLHYIRKMGNVAAHDGELNCDDSLKILEELHFVVGEFAIFLGLVDDYPEFAHPSGKIATREAVKKAEEVSKKEEPEVPSELIAEFSERMRDVRFDVKHGRDEGENKRLYMASSLREAGWAVVNKPNQALPCSAGINMILDDGDTVDYILYGRDNRPLAVIEYTTTNQNLVQGRLKAIEKANKLGAKYGSKPVAYYTNGYHIYVIDQLGYKPRRVFQFHSIEELELLKLRRDMRGDISNPVIDDSITNRDYQKQAITNACRAFTSMRRRTLLVMATGTGKTRVSISLVDVLTKANWVKNVLFLADRTSLVRQAHKNFTKLLPSVTTSVYSGGSLERDANARIIFSTYQTMINLINDDTREFGIGRFDLIVVDEAHRSIFKKYAALFNYFDALMIGLTATPRCEENKSTYEIFELPNGEPDFAYELEEAVQNGHLVGFSVLDRTTDAMRRGISYDSLTEKEKESFEDEFAIGDKEIDFSGTVLSAKKMRSNNVINKGTIDAMLGDHMKNGLRVDAGDKIGKTIIFARNHTEAEIVVERFNKLYPHLGAGFCELIDSQVENNLNLIDNFEQRDNVPQVAVSVDMMDTGIDVPDVLNLVFFKSIGSKIKFLQMIGRGTRLSKDVFGPGMDKTGFLIFDYYDNFRYFNTKDTWTTVNGSSNKKTFTITPQSTLIYQQKLGILRNLCEEAHGTFEVEYLQELKDFFIETVTDLNNDDIRVQYDMSYVSKYRTPEQWDSFTDEKIEEIEKHILPLFPPIKDGVKAKNFDLMIYLLEKEVPRRILEDKDVRKIRHGFGNVCKKIDDVMVELLKLKTIPEIVEKEDLIDQMRFADYIYEDFSLLRCEYVREVLRPLMKYIPDDSRYYILDIADCVVDGEEDTPFGARTETYADKVKKYVDEGGAIISKIRNLDELTDREKEELEVTFKSTLGTESDFATWSNNKPLLVALRIYVGIADEAIQTKFGSFLNSSELDEEQLAYMHQIIDYAKANGDIVFLDLQRVSPFCDVDIMSTFGTKLSYIKTLVNGLHKPII